jgi:hypothetical protein
MQAFFAPPVQKGKIGTVLDQLGTGNMTNPHFRMKSHF